MKQWKLQSLSLPALTIQYCLNQKQYYMNITNQTKYFTPK